MANLASSSLTECYSRLSELIEAGNSRWNQEAWRAEVSNWRIRTAERVCSTLLTRKSPADIDLIETMLALLNHGGANDFEAGFEAESLAQSYRCKGWAGVAAAILLVPSWQAKSAPELKDAPLWIAPLLATYAFGAPRTLTTPGQAEAYTRVYLEALKAVVAIVESNRGSETAKALVERFLPVEDCAAATLIPDLHVQIRANRARLLAALTRQVSPVEPWLEPRTNRPLRLGIIAKTISESSDGLALARVFERLPASRVKISLVVAHASNSAVERHLINRGAILSVMSGEPDQIAEDIRALNLDVGVLLTEGPWIGNPIAQIALQRIMPLQFIYDGTGLPSGLPFSDLYAAGPVVPNGYKERGVLLTPAGLAGVGGLQVERPPEAWTQATVGLRGVECVFGYLGPLSSITPEIAGSWAQILAAAPAARLIIVAPSVPGYRADRFCQTLARVLQSHGVASERVSVFEDVALKTLEERKAALGAIDVLLDASSFDNGENACAALASHRPLITWATPANAAATLLAEADSAATVAADQTSYVQIATKLAADATLRAEVAARLARNAPAVLANHDSFALGEALAGILETAFDSAASSRKALQAGAAALTPDKRSDEASVIAEAEMFLELGSLQDAESRLRSVLSSSSQPAPTRRLLAAVLSRRGQNAVAADLLVSVVEIDPSDPSLWLELGDAAWKAGRPDTAIQALQTSVKIDPTRVDSWQFLVNLARETGNHELRRQFESVLQELGVHAPTQSPLNGLQAVGA